MNLVRYMNNRAPANKRYQPTEYEHAANCATHALWIIPSIMGGVLLYFLSNDQWEETSAWLYGAGLSSLFTISTAFHIITWKKSHLRYKVIELVCYTAMGVFPALVVLSMTDRAGLYELLVGGGCYVLGMVFFKSDGVVPFAHAIWHLFVAMGAGIHYYAIWKYLYTPVNQQTSTAR
ncbi:monocyte to macrophage differentiation factor 2-like isoform X5 [Electrophorus electricus]|uniref:monocyte to macrophage differentiation factor 2-like isoform X5 n=1 Tax=Electrophorus electricus TaxID=8005 RepID=UPI000F0A5472|nr:monocyte to macrophage differentiation factor 2-like isoform X5 [Electrophorus electricus]